MDQKLKAFLDLIAYSEGTSLIKLPDANEGYGVLVTGVNGPATFSDYSTHPNILVTVRENPLLQSTAAGRYQLLYRWFHPYCAQLGLNDFSPESQDAIAVQQIRERHAVAMIETGDVEGAIIACSNIWASFPGNSYGQGGRSMADLLSHYQSFYSAGGLYAVAAGQ